MPVISTMEFFNASEIGLTDKSANEHWCWFHAGSGLKVTIHDVVLISSHLSLYFLLSATHCRRQFFLQSVFFPPPNFSSNHTLCSSYWWQTGLQFLEPYPIFSLLQANLSPNLSSNHTPKNRIMYEQV